MGKQYCCVCNNYRGEIVESRVVSLHRIPINKHLRQVWIRRLRLIRKDFTLSKHSDICSEHFVGFHGPVKSHEIPSIFPQKTFTTSSLSDTPVPNDVDDLPCPSSSALSTDCDECTEAPLSVQQSGRSFDTLSVIFHDYCRVMKDESISNSRHKECQTTTVTTVTTSTQTDETIFQCLHPYSGVNVMTQTRTETKPKMCDMSVQAMLPDITFYDVKNDAEMVNFYTGFNDEDCFGCLFDELTDIHKEQFPSSTVGRPKCLSLIDEFFMTLMRLRLGLLIVDIANRFHISKTTCADIINKWIDILHEHLSFLVQWPSRDIIDANMPEGFKQLYPTTRVVIDCTELFSEKPYSLIKQSQMYSHYKRHITYKGLIGITLNGVVSFVSDLWSGSISDRQIAVKSGLIDLCEGDAIMVDKGFTISDLTTPKGVALIIPPRKRKREQLSSGEISTTRRIANLRIHVERHMERVKKFRILQGIIPITVSSSINKIWKYEML